MIRQAGFEKTGFEKTNVGEQELKIFS